MTLRMRYDDMKLDRTPWRAPPTADSAICDGRHSVLVTSPHRVDECCISLINHVDYHYLLCSNHPNERTNSTSDFPRRTNGTVRLAERRRRSTWMQLRQRHCIDRCLLNCVRLGCYIARQCLPFISCITVSFIYCHIFIHPTILFTDEHITVSERESESRLV